MSRSDATRVMPGPLREMTAEVFRRLGLPETDAEQIADCLVRVDLRGVFTHGTRQLRNYVREYRTGGYNPCPTVRLLRETSASALFDGDGGIGYLVVTRATEKVIEKAEAEGIAVAGTRFHGHVGSAGIYARTALTHDLVTFSVAGWTPWRPPDLPDATVWDAIPSPPMCFGIPSAKGPPLVVDISANLFLHSGSRFRKPDHLAGAMRDYAEPIIKSLGLKFAASLLGGVLAGTLPPSERGDAYPSARRGFLIAAFHPDTVGESEGFKQEVTRIIAESRALDPLPGKESAEVPGSLEWQRERDWAWEGIPLRSDHREILEKIAGEMGVEVPW